MDTTPEDEKTRKAHAWQGHRLRCVELAVAGKTCNTGGELVATARLVSEYIMAPDPRERPANDVKRPDWPAIHAGSAHTPDRDEELLTVTRETLRLALSTLRASQLRDAYHNMAAAVTEIDGVLK